MAEKKEPVFLFGNVAQCRQDGVLNPQHLMRAVIESVLLPESRLTLREFFIKRVFSNGGDITNKEICVIASELFGEHGSQYVEILERRGALERFGYSRDEMRLIRDTLDALQHAEVTLVCEVPERLHQFEDAVCAAIGFRFAAHNRHHR